MKNFVRGAGVHIAVTFKNHMGGIVTPTGAEVTLSYVPVNSESCARSFLTYPLVQDTASGLWEYDWDSSVAETGPVYGNAVTTTPSVPVSSVDFEFRLTANRANKELAGDDWSLGY